MFVFLIEKLPLYEATILSACVFAFRLQLTIVPCSVPTINLVGIVDSYSNVVQQSALAKSIFFVMQSVCKINASH